MRPLVATKRLVENVAKVTLILSKPIALAALDPVIFAFAMKPKVKDASDPNRSCQDDTEKEALTVFERRKKTFPIYLDLAERRTRRTPSKPKNAEFLNSRNVAGVTV